jgi:hypothetical protein
VQMMEKLIRIVSNAEFRSRSLSDGFGKGISHPLLKEHKIKDVISYSLCNHAYKALWLWSRNIKTGKETKEDKILFRTALVYAENLMQMAMECRNNSRSDIEAANYIISKIKLMINMVDVMDIHGNKIKINIEM